MPHKPLKPCLYPGCTKTVPSGYCQAHAHFYTPPARAVDNRPSAAARGYGKRWQAIRNEVLCRSGIPRELWHLYDIHHEPPYNPAIEPNHRAYKLTPMLHRDHSRETMRSRGRGGKSLGNMLETGKAKGNIYSSKMEAGGQNGR